MYDSHSDCFEFQCGTGMVQMFQFQFRAIFAKCSVLQTEFPNDMNAAGGVLIRGSIISILFIIYYNRKTKIRISKQIETTMKQFTRVTKLESPFSALTMASAHGPCENKQILYHILMYIEQDHCSKLNEKNVFN